MLTKLRVSSQYLRIETGRYGKDRVNRQDRICNMCLTEAEDEYHFIIKCALYEDIRKLFLNRNIYTQSSMETFFSLL
mgnify:FL=1